VRMQRNCVTAGGAAALFSSCKVLPPARARAPARPTEREGRRRDAACPISTG
jgi:hypothetical protein